MKVKLLFESDCHSHNEGIVIFLKYLIEKKFIEFDIESVTEKKNGEISDKFGIFIILEKINEQIPFVGLLLPVLQITSGIL